MAIEQKYVDLINASLDNELGDAERGELADYLAANVEAQSMHDDLANLCGALDSMPQVEPPPHLKYAILDSVVTSNTLHPDRSGGWQSIFAMPVFRHAVAFAAGAFMTFALISSNQISDRAFDDVTGLVGTISDTDVADANARSINLTTSELAGTVTIHQSGALTILSFNLAAAGPVEIEAGYSDTDLWFKGFAQLENDGTNVSAGAGLVKMTLQGRNRYAMYFHHGGRQDAAVHLRFFAAGTLIHEADLSLGESGEISELTTNLLRRAQ